MEKEDIKKLLERYYNGETDLNEEQVLKDFFAGDDVPQDMVADRDLFLRLSEMSSCDVDMPDDMKTRLSARIDEWGRQTEGKRIYSMYRYVSGVAATVLLVLGLGYSILEDRSVETVYDTFDSPQEAYLETQRALQLFSDAIDKGTVGLHKAGNTTRKVGEKIDNMISIGK